jgi:hypothetical protein
MAEAQSMAVVIGTWLCPFMAPVILALAHKFAVHKGWRKPPPSFPTTFKTESSDAELEILKAIRDDLKVIKDNIRDHPRVLAETVKELKEGMDILKQFGEARSRDGEVLIYRRVPHVPGAAAHLADG